LKFGFASSRLQIGSLEVGSLEARITACHELHLLGGIARGDAGTLSNYPCKSECRVGVK